MALPAELFGFHGHARLTGDDVLHHVVDVRLGDVPHTSRSEKGNDLPADTADIGGDVLLVKLFDGQHPPVFFSFFCGVVTMSDPAKLRFRFTTRGLRRPYAMQAYRIATRTSS